MELFSRAKAARWSVELVDTTSSSSSSVLRLRSCYGRYLTASNEPFLLGMTGRKVIQTLPRRLDSSVEWEPIRDGFQVRLKTRYGHFLRANGGVLPWRNSITHDIPHRTSTSDAVRIADLRAWLVSQFESACREVPGFEFTPRTLSRLRSIAALSQSRSRATSIVATDLRLKASEFRSQAARIHEILDAAALSPDRLYRPRSPQLRP